MWLGLNPGAWVFWINLLVLLCNVGAAIAFRRVYAELILGALTSGGAVMFILLAQGTCVLPQDSVVEFRQGMTICPGQAATGHIEVRQ